MDIEDVIQEIEDTIPKSVKTRGTTTFKERTYKQILHDSEIIYEDFYGSEKPIK